MEQSSGTPSSVSPTDAALAVITLAACREGKQQDRECMQSGWADESRWAAGLQAPAPRPYRTSSKPTPYTVTEPRLHKESACRRVLCARSRCPCPCKQGARRAARLLQAAGKGHAQRAQRVAVVAAWAGAGVLSKIKHSVHRASR